jgi:small subunit ribosomal protein S20
MILYLFLYKIKEKFSQKGDNLPKTLFAKKRARQSLKRRAYSQKAKTKIRSLAKKVEKSADWNEAIENLKLATKALDKAAKLKIIHKNKASRTKSQLAKLANSKKK